MSIRDHTLTVKIQRPLASSDALERTPWMVYTQDRRFQMTCRPSPSMVEAMGDRAKVYARVTLEGDPLTVTEVLEDQPW